MPIFRKAAFTRLAARVPALLKQSPKNQKLKTWPFRARMGTNHVMFVPYKSYSLCML